MFSALIRVSFHRSIPRNRARKMANQIEEFLILTQGEVLMILANRAKPKGIGRDEIAAALGIEPGSVSRIYRYKALSHQQIISACNLFGVPPEVFDPEKTVTSLFQLLADQQRQISENRERIDRLEREKGNCEIEKAGLRSLIRSQN